MSLEIVNKKEIAPENKIFIVGGRNMGSCRRIGKALWEAMLRIEDELNSDIGLFCIEEKGKSPQDALAAVIIAARLDHDARAKNLAWMERELGTIGKADTEIADSIAVFFASEEENDK